MYNIKLKFKYDINRAGLIPVFLKKIENNKKNVSTAYKVLNNTVKNIKKIKVYFYVFKNKRKNVVFIKIIYLAIRYYFVKKNKTTILFTSVSFFFSI